MRQGILILAAGRVRLKKRKTKKKREIKSAEPKTHHKIHSRPKTTTTSRRRATNHVPRVGPYSHASIDPGLVEIVLDSYRKHYKQRMLRIHTDTRTD